MNHNQQNEILKKGAIPKKILLVVSLLCTLSDFSFHCFCVKILHLPDVHHM